MSKTNEDKRTTKMWALARVNQFAVGAMIAEFRLANRVTKRAHELLFVGGGFALGTDIPIDSSSHSGKEELSELRYIPFDTKRPVSFSDFDSTGARVSAVKAQLGVGVDAIAITCWTGEAYFSDLLFKLTDFSWAGGFPGASGQALVHGVFKVNYKSHGGTGKPYGKVPPAPKNIEHDNPRISKPSPETIEPRLSDVSVKAREAPVTMIPSDVLFDFDKSTLKSSANSVLERAKRVIDNRDRGQVYIVGYTDSVGGKEYNYRLSLRRAQSVKRWLIKKKTYKAKDFVVEGRGPSNPVAPNRRSDGSDNPDGRAKNRRVEIIFRSSSRSK